MKIVLDSGATMPTRAHEFDAGLDLYSTEEKTINPYGFETFETGVHIELPKWTYGLIQSKSGLNSKHGVVCCGGTIDSGYTGAIKVTLYNFGKEAYTIRDGDKVAQLVIMPCYLPELELSESLHETDRGDKGFGSTGR